MAISFKLAGVIGGSFGGLTAAHALRKIGFEVELFERAPKLPENDGAVALWSPAIDCLRVLGLAQAVWEHGELLRRPGYRLSDGTWLARASMDHKSFLLALPRASLQKALLQSLPADVVHTNHELSALEQLPDGVRIAFTNGRKSKFDFIVGADGTWSTTRRLLGGYGVLPKYQGYTRWGATVPFDLKAEDAFETWGSGRKFGILPLRDKRVYWYAASREPELMNRTGAGADQKERLCAMFKGWHAPICDLIAQTPAAAIRSTDVFDMEVLPQWSNNRVALVGDACHTIPPDTSQGVCLAIEDALELGSCLAPLVPTADRREVAEVMKTYQDVRRERAQISRRWARLAAATSMLEAPVLQVLRNSVCRVFPAALERILAAAAIRSILGDYGPQPVHEPDPETLLESPAKTPRNQPLLPSSSFMGVLGPRALLRQEPEDEHPPKR